jgi:hypothetical protein
VALPLAASLLSEGALLQYLCLSGYVQLRFPYLHAGLSACDHAGCVSSMCTNHQQGLHCAYNVTKTPAISNTPLSVRITSSSHFDVWQGPE